MAERRIGPADWLAVSGAIERILGAVRPVPAERVVLAQAGGRVLAEPVVSPIDLPAWDNSAMDGYAVRAADIRGARPDAPVRLTVVDEVPAGGFPARPIGPGEAAKVMTGAPVPEGADTVVRVEHTDAWVAAGAAGGPGGGPAESRAAGRAVAGPGAAGAARMRSPGGAGGTVAVLRDDDAGSHIRRRGEDVRCGRTVLEGGRMLGSGAIGLLAAVGCGVVAVHRRPRVAILATGDELVDLDRFDEVVAGRKLVDSNGPALAAAVSAAGAEPVRLGIAADDVASLRSHLEQGLEADALITVAGASVGERDLVRDALAELGFRLDFWRVRMRPGSPFSFGRIGDLPVFGLPGNPVSALVTFEVLVRPALRRMLGRAAVHSPAVRARAAERIAGAGDRTHFVRVRLEGDAAGDPMARPTGPQGSGILGSMAVADGLLVVPAGRAAIEPGESAAVIPVALMDAAAERPGFATEA